VRPLRLRRRTAGAAQDKLGLIDNWLRHIQDIMMKHNAALAAAGDAARRLDRLCELNVIEQVLNVCQTTIVENAWAHGNPITVHGWIYSIADGLLRDLGVSIAEASGVEAARLAARGGSA
jgi:carbonic anhydrase